MHPSSYGGRIGAPVVRGVGGRMADPAEHAAMWELSERETGITLASILG